MAKAPLKLKRAPKMKILLCFTISCLLLICRYEPGNAMSLPEKEDGPEMAKAPLKLKRANLNPNCLEWPEECQEDSNCCSGVCYLTAEWTGYIHNICLEL